MVILWGAVGLAKADLARIEFFEKKVVRLCQALLRMPFVQVGKGQEVFVGFQTRYSQWGGFRPGRRPI